MSVVSFSDPCARMKSGGPLNLDSTHPVEVDCYVPTDEEIQKVLGASPTP
jgi:hypothetical protein